MLHPVKLSRWLRDNTTIFDYVILKLDVEGAEYNILEKMIRDRTIRRINHLFIEWHWNKVGIFGGEAPNIAARLAPSTRDDFRVGRPGLLGQPARQGLPVMEAYLSGPEQLRNSSQARKLASL
jgi:hypothetical protein